MAAKFPTSLVVGLVIGALAGYAAGTASSGKESSSGSPAGSRVSIASEPSRQAENSGADRPATPKASEPSPTPTAPAAPVVAEPEQQTSDWVVQESVDAMTDQPVRHSCATSSNKVSLDFPYGLRGARLCIRKHPKFGQDVFLSLDGSGQILCASYDGCTIPVRFDDGKVEQFSAAGPSDNSSETVFLSNDSRFIASARKAQRVRVQVEFYQNGTFTFDFPARGLEW